MVFFRIDTWLGRLDAVVTGPTGRCKYVISCAQSMHSSELAGGPVSNESGPSYQNLSTVPNSCYSAAGYKLYLLPWLSIPLMFGHTEGMLRHYFCNV